MFELKQYSGIQEEIIWGGDSICENKSKQKVSPYASPASRLIIRAFPPAYAFVGVVNILPKFGPHINQLKKLALRASIDVYHTDIHAFDMLRP